MNPSPDCEVPPYACFIHGRIDDAFEPGSEIIKLMRVDSCQTCGYPYHHAGPMCASCASIEERKVHAMGKALMDVLDPRNVHVHGRGLVCYNDPDYRDFIE